MTRITTILLILFLMTNACKKEEKPGRYDSCNGILYASCDGTGYGDYCTFGFKWGDHNGFDNPGLNMPGPGSGPVEITYAFKDAGYTFNTHREENLVSLSFDEENPCIKRRVRAAFAQWQSVAAVSFIEVSSTATPNINIILADAQQAGLGFPAFSELPCSELAGLLLLSPINDPWCDLYFFLALHEIGHVLGLGHVNSNNVMNPKKSYYNLQEGDILGIQSIYGPKQE